jgi:hypothetical protein
LNCSIDFITTSCTWCETNYFIKTNFWMRHLKEDNWSNNQHFHHQNLFCFFWKKIKDNIQGGPDSHWLRITFDRNAAKEAASLHSFMYYSTISVDHKMVSQRSSKKHWPTILRSTGIVGWYIELCSDTASFEQWKPQLLIVFLSKFIRNQRLSGNFWTTLYIIRASDLWTS